MIKDYLAQHSYKGELPVLDFECLRLEIQSFYTSNKSLFNQLTDKKEMTVAEATKDVFLKLITDYAVCKGRPEAAMLNYQLAES